MPLAVGLPALGYSTENVVQCGQSGPEVSHPVRLGCVHRPICVIVHQFVDAADRLEAQQGVLVLTELLVYRTQICNTMDSQRKFLCNTFSFQHRRD